MQNNLERDRPRYLVESVDSALAVLLLVAEHKEVRVTDVARELGIARSTAHRLLRTLVWREFLTQDRVSRAYRAGRALIDMTTAVAPAAWLRTIARPHLLRLFEETGETVNLLVREGANARFIDSIDGARRAPLAATVGTVLPAVVIAGGKVLIAWLDEEERRALYPSGIPRLTPRTTTDFESLAVEFEQIRRHGYALNLDGSYFGFSAIGVPVRGPNETITAAVTISARSERLTQDSIRRFLGPLLTSAAAIAAELRARTAPRA